MAQRNTVVCVVVTWIARQRGHMRTSGKSHYGFTIGKCITMRSFPSSQLKNKDTQSGLVL